MLAAKIVPRREPVPLCKIGMCQWLQNSQLLMFVHGAGTCQNTSMLIRRS